MKFKFRSPLYHFCIAGFDFHCGSREGQIKEVQLSWTNQNHRRSKGPTFSRISHCSLSLQQETRKEKFLPHFMFEMIALLKRVMSKKKGEKEICFFLLFLLPFKHSLGTD